MNIQNAKPFVLGAVIALFSSIVFGQDTPQTTQRRFIQTTGEATVTAEPNRARIDIGVVTQANTSQAAAEQNASKTQNVITRLRALVGSAGEIKTVGYNLSPNYVYPREGGEPRITGYTASNVVRVTLDDLTKVGPAIDAATQAGANRIQQLQFLLKDERPTLDQALREASLNARRKADSIASAIGVRVIRVMSVTESGRTAIPLQDTFVMRAEATQTPVEPGTLEVRASVTLTVEIG